jgi:hypothetical protein
MEAARFLGISRWSVFKLIRLGKLRPTRTKALRRTTFAESELERFVALNTRQDNGR